jgi:hypothetical protein
MTLENIRDICTQQILPPCSHSFDEGSYKANVTASMAAAFGRRPMYGRPTGAEISYGKLAHVADDLAMSKMQTGLSVTNQGGIGDHGERDSCA